MRHLLIATSLAAVLAVPTLADAQTRCEQRQSDNRVAGTVIGAVGGALLGSAIAGRGDRTTGAVIGGVGGAVVGNRIAAGSDGRCPEGYEPVVETAYGPPPPPPPGRYNYSGAAPTMAALDLQEDQLSRRIMNARDRGRLDRGQAARAMDELRDIRSRESDLRARHGGRLTDDDSFFLQERLDRLSATVRDERTAGAPPPPPPPPADFWTGAPQGLDGRADWLQQRINTDAARGALTRAGVAEAQDALNGFRSEQTALRTRDGGRLRDVDRQYLDDRLEYLAQRMLWMESVRR